MHTLLQSLFPLLLITSFLLVNVELNVCADDIQYENCSKRVRCGGIGGIGYPFWGVNRASYCGLPGFEVQCLDNVPVINMSNINYRILKTDFSVPSVTVARQDYWKTICPPTFVNISINFSLFNYTSGLTNLTFYYGCSIPGPMSSSPVCSTNNGDITVLYITRSPPLDLFTTGTCTNGVTVPVSMAAVVALEFNQTTIEDAVDGGFELELKIDSNDQCNSCRESGGYCGRNTTGGFSCFCYRQAYATTCN